MTTSVNPANIRNIIFDFGGVIIDISHQKVENAFRDLGFEDFDLVFNQAIQSELFQHLETGAITPGEFRRHLKQLANLNIPDHLFDDAWNQIIGDYPPRRIELLKQVKSNYKTFILSNTNEIHFNFYTKKFKKEFGFPLYQVFDETYWSFIIGKRKPDSEAFEHVMEINRLVAGETLFIDDSKQNVIAAEGLGLSVWHLRQGEDITDLFVDGKLIHEFISLL
jgi:putative hydrolase of the HAD superfamily